MIANYNEYINMISSFSSYSNDKWDDHKGSYVLLSCSGFIYSEFIENNIGVITKVYYPGAWFNVKYENVPKNLEIYLNREFNTADIKYISKNKEDLKAILVGKKYNL